MIQFKALDQSGGLIKSALSPFTFPAGEAHTKREDRRELEDTEITVLYGSQDMHADLFQLAMWNNYLLNTDKHVKRVLVIPYLPGARADRGVPFGLEIYAEFINNLGLDQVIVFDPHSSMTVQALQGGANLDVVYPHDALDPRQNRSFDLSQFDGIIAPDKGAVVRATGVADLAKLPVFTAEKTRDFETGKLTGFAIHSLPKTGRYLIVDDICDGGGTFMGLAEATGLDREQLHLYVSHGVFSKMALYNLPLHFARIYTTNSYNPRRDLNEDPDFDYPVVQRFDVIDLLMKRIIK